MRQHNIMIVTYRNNRLVPAVVISACLWGVYHLVDVRLPAESYHTVVLPDWRKPPSQVGQDVDIDPHSHRTAAVWSPPSPAQTPSPTKEDQANKPHHDGSLTPEDVLLIMKTGYTSLWKRLLIHLTTSLSPTRIPQSNSVIYSDAPSTIGSFNIIDILENSTHALKSTHPDFDIYRQQPLYDTHNIYVESAGVEGDNFGPAGGWIIDKYKFIPLIQHAGKNHPNAKWYIYMEDDTYLFLPNILKYLSKFNWKQPHYLGSFAGKSDVIFAHGGAGFVLSRGAWEKSFGQNNNMAEEYEEYTAAHCCGDQVLGHALNKYGVKFGANDGDEKFTWGFNPIVHWRFGFERWNWCAPLLSWHKVHARDVARYYQLEQQWDLGKDGPIKHGDFAEKVILPELKARKNKAEWWDNFSAVWQVSSGNKNDPPGPEGKKYDESKWKKAWESVEDCEEACKSWEECVQWSWVEDLCKMDNKFMMGQGYAPAMPERKTALKRTSGWLTERLETWKCK
ncbi:hypothetical protein B0T21DRAFT_362585 [Apiosordaria backusii]|uniref:N-acetylgalactosaminide beta-1,3-galactosyltransferase n=1 Tax=Apiosordaria backusii TaxID=314023 RepID=A0AA40BS94_9PEZI|nr:hypothetical protein B0T21DRAFT_362585 [Apiosordaria backusii]